MTATASKTRANEHTCYHSLSDRWFPTATVKPSSAAKSEGSINRRTIQMTPQNAILNEQMLLKLNMGRRGNGQLFLRTPPHAAPPWGAWRRGNPISAPRSGLGKALPSPGWAIPAPAAASPPSAARRTCKSRALGGLGTEDLLSCSPGSAAPPPSAIFHPGRSLAPLPTRLPRLPEPVAWQPRVGGTPFFQHQPTYPVPFFLKGNWLRISLQRILCVSFCCTPEGAIGRPRGQQRLASSFNSVREMSSACLSDQNCNLTFSVLVKFSSSRGLGGMSPPKHESVLRMKNTVNALCNEN